MKRARYGLFGCWPGLYVKKGNFPFAITFLNFYDCVAGPLASLDLPKCSAILVFARLEEPNLSSCCFPPVVVGPSKAG